MQSIERHSLVSSPDLIGRSSIPETAVLEPRSRGVLDAPPSRGMTVEDVETRHTFTCSRHNRPRFALRFSSLAKQREQGMPGARCTRGLVCKMHKEKRTRAYRFSGGSPAFPAQWLYGLCRALPGDEFVLVTVVGGLRLIKLGRVDFASAQLGTSNGCRDHTVLPYATSVVRLAQRPFAHKPKLALRLPTAPALPRPPHPNPRS